MIRRNLLGGLLALPFTNIAKKNTFNTVTELRPITATLKHAVDISDLLHSIINSKKNVERFVKSGDMAKVFGVSIYMDPSGIFSADKNGQ